MRVLLSLVLAISCYASYINELYTLTDKQKVVMENSLLTGLSEGYGYLLAAIAWKESNFGKKTINHSDGRHGSYGIFQNLLTTVVSREKADITNKEVREHFKKKLLEDYEYSSRMAIEELKAWKRYHKGNLRKAVASYNAGWKYENGERYMRDVFHRVNVLKQFHKTNNKAYLNVEDLKGCL